MKVGVLSRTMPRLFDCAALQRHRGMQQLTSTWASCLSEVGVLCRKELRPSDSTAGATDATAALKRLGV